MALLFWVGTDSINGSCAFSRTRKPTLSGKHCHLIGQVLTSGVTICSKVELWVRRRAPHMRCRLIVKHLPTTHIHGSRIGVSKYLPADCRLMSCWRDVSARGEDKSRARSNVRRNNRTAVDKLKTLGLTVYRCGRLTCHALRSLQEAKRRKGTLGTCHLFQRRRTPL